MNGEGRRPEQHGPIHKQGRRGESDKTLAGLNRGGFLLYQAVYCFKPATTISRNRAVARASNPRFINQNVIDWLPSPSVLLPAGEVR